MAHIIRNETKGEVQEGKSSKQRISPGLKAIREKRKRLEAEVSWEKLRATVKGIIVCNKCSKTLNKAVCNCGYSLCHVMVYWKRKHRRFYRYTDGEPLNFPRAIKMLTQINHAINSKTFNPTDWLIDSKAKRFDNQVMVWLEEIKDEVRAGALAPETLKTYRSYVHNHFNEFFGAYDVREIRYEQISEFKRFLGQRVSINTRKRIMGVLHIFFMWMLRNGIIKEQVVFPKVEGEDIVRKAVDIQSQEEILKLIPETHRDIFEFGCETGLRPNELCAIKVGDINFSNRIAIIQHGYSGTVFHNNTKGKNKWPIPLSDRAYNIALKNRKDKLPSTFLFTNPKTGKGYPLHTLDIIWARHVGRGITKNEVMRHSFVTHLFEMGLPAEIVQVFSRHRDKSSLRNYVHINPVK
ncbi:MAG: tyrosine-type recombinase/integrase, partial [Nitrospirota bacterium]